MLTNQFIFTIWDRFRPWCLFGFFAVAVLSACSAAEGATTYVSSISATSISSTQSLYDDRWHATSFTAGTNAGGYNFDSVTFRFDTPNGSPDQLQVKLYTAAGSSPGTEIEALTGAFPNTAGEFTFSSSGNPFLASGGRYFIVFETNVSLPSSFQLARGVFGEAQTSLEGWVINDDDTVSSDSGANWFSLADDLQWSVDATAVPEPSSAILLLGSCWIAVSRRVLRKR